MNVEKLIQLYEKEREYQKKCFGDYENVKSINFGSFLLFIEEYLRKAKAAYCGPWQKETPVWLVWSKEMEEGSAPVEAYEQLIKVMALVGAALETYSDIDSNQWRLNPEEDGQKWK